MKWMIAVSRERRMERRRMNLAERKNNLVEDSVLVFDMMEVGRVWEAVDAS